VFLGWLILDEPLTVLSVVAMVIILAGVALVQSAGWRKATPVPEAVPVKTAA
jgi:drug/metabolite transporter (DMT)-like permease